MLFIDVDYTILAFDSLLIGNSTTGVLLTF